MYRPLHTLRLALPGTPRLKYVKPNVGFSSDYVWPCGCRGTGVDPEALKFASCTAHRELLHESPITRIML